ncbi:glycosyltransferase [Terribacillus sp. DMT04]|uniref:glycosyltransferase family 2 protein n=1 Tax=Terribacillus sp. DMT04 TaxID=2850441 RepID=UPI001C2C8DAC|nr:glycosyltransferase [Terribacillus sp. DMT04]QXE00859.1 glycosyltransferase [Terribacillus sp. DMT04]
MSIGVVLPVYNQQAAYVYECIEAMEKQVYRDFKLIIVIDGANQDTVEAVYKASRSLTIPYRIIYRKKNMGISYSLNEGFSYLTDCPYLTWISIDNRQNPLFLLTLYNHMKRAPEDTVLLYSYYWLINEEGQRFADAEQWLRTMETLMNRDKEEIMSICFIGASFLFRQSAYKKAGGYDPDYGVVSDYEFWIRLLEQGEIGLIRDPLMEYRVNGALSLTTITGPQGLYLQSMNASLDHRKKRKDIPDVTILITARNQGAYINTCLNSVLNQTHTKIHIVAVDIGSTDNTLQKITSVNDPRIIPLHIKDGTKAEALNVGLRYALGKYVLELDGDDWLDEKAVEIMLAEFSKLDKSYGLLYANKKIWYDNPSSGLQEGKIVSGPEYTDKIHVLSDVQCPSPRMYRKSALDKLGGWQEEINGENLLEAADYMMFCRMADSFKIHWLNSTLYHERVFDDAADKTLRNYQIRAVVQYLLQQWDNISIPAFKTEGDSITKIYLQ